MSCAYVLVCQNVSKSIFSMSRAYFDLGCSESALAGVIRCFLLAGGFEPIAFISSSLVDFFGTRVERRMSGTTICCIPVPFELVIPCLDGCPPTDWSAWVPPFLAAWCPLFCGKVSVASEGTGCGCPVLDATMDSEPKLNSSGGGSLLF